jgi:hypothetical protein
MLVEKILDKNIQLIDNNMYLLDEWMSNYHQQDDFKLQSCEL